MSKLRCLIVDDEPLARVQLRALLLEQPETELVGEAGTLAQAREAAARHRPDVVLLDIQLRNESGFDLLGELDSDTAVIFVTAHDRHAVRAFDTEAADYLLKPVDGARLGRALSRVRERAGKHAGSPEARRMLQLGASGEFVAAREILCIEADGHRSVVSVGAERKVVRQQIGEWAGMVPAGDFAQLDRGVIVNLRRVVSLRRDGAGGTVLFDVDRAQLSLGAAATRRLRELLEKGI